MRRSSTATVIAAALAAVTLAGCSTTLAGTPTVASKAPVTTEQETPTEAATDSEESTETEPTESDSGDVLPPLDPTFPELTESSQANTGGSLDSDSISWLTTFCTGFNDVMAYAGPDTTGMSDEATVQTIADAYNAMASAADSLASDLQTVPQPTFGGASAMTSAIDSWLHAITTVYGTGAQAIATTQFTSADQLTDMINQIEAGMQQPTADLGGAMGGVDPAVQAALYQIPECAPLLG